MPRDTIAAIYPKIARTQETLLVPSFQASHRHFCVDPVMASTRNQGLESLLFNFIISGRLHYFVLRDIGKDSLLFCFCSDFLADQLCSRWDPRTWRICALKLHVDVFDDRTLVARRLAEESTMFRFEMPVVHFHVNDLHEFDLGC